MIDSRHAAAAALAAACTAIAAAQVRQAWVEVYDGPAAGIGSADVASAIAMDADGNVYVAGDSKTDDAIVQDYATVKYAPDGTLLWERRFNGSGNGNDYARAIAVDEAGCVHVTGFSWGATSAWDYTTIKYSPDGDVLWIRHYMGPGDVFPSDQATAIALDDDGSVLVTGNSMNAAGTTDYATVKYDSGGEELWARRYDGPAGAADDATAIALDADGNVIVTGRSIDYWFMGELPVYDYATIKYTPDGETLWVHRSEAGTDRSDEAAAVAVDASGNVHVTGVSADGFGLGVGRYATLKLHPGGELLWQRDYFGPVPSYAAAKAMAIDGAGNAYVTGWSWSGTGDPFDFDYATLKYDPGGAQLWEQRYQGPGLQEDLASGIALDGRGGVYVTGTSQRIFGGGFPDVESYDYLTLKYTVQGNLHWERRYNGPDDDSDEGRVVAVGADGAVAVAGWSTSSATGADFATVMYVQITGDLDGNGLVGISDLLILLAAWGSCPDSPAPCLADLDGDGLVSIVDLLSLLAGWA